MRVVSDMGMDVNLYAEVGPTPEELEKAEEFFVARSSLGDTWDGRFTVLCHRTSNWLPTPRVEVNTLIRYYGKGYERGDWPVIYGAIRVLQSTFPDSKVFYGSDSSDDGQECTDEFLSSVWAHFLSPDGNNYRKSFR